MTVLAMNGLDHQIAFAQRMGFDEARAPTRVRNSAEDGRRWFEVDGGHAGDHDRGGQFDVNESGDLWVGWRIRAGSGYQASNLGDGIRVALIYVNSVRAIQLVWWEQAAKRYFQLHDGTESESAITDGDNLAQGGTWDGTGERHMKLHVTNRDATGGDVEFYLDGDLMMTATAVPGLATGEGAITGVVWSGRSSNVATQTNRFLRYRDIWIDDAVDVGNAEVALMLPNAQGTYDDGTLTGATSKVDAVSNTPPDLTEFVSIGASDRESYVYDGSAVAASDRLFVSAVQPIPLFDTEVSVDLFTRDGGSDEALATLDSKGSGVDGYRTISIIDPHTSTGWSKAKLESGIEIGCEVG